MLQYRTDMARKLRDKASLLCVVLLTILLYGIGIQRLSVMDMKHVQPLCQPSNLTSSYYISSDVVSWKIIENELKNVQPGGRYKPKNCISTWKVAIIVPYRNRENHLKVFLRNIHPFLQQQQLEYGLFVIEMRFTEIQQACNFRTIFKQDSEVIEYDAVLSRMFSMIQDANTQPLTAFNRGLLMNAGFNESRRLFSYNCFIFHDVDLLPETIKNIYNCSDHPKHMASAIDTRNYTMTYTTYFGGVNSFSKDQFILVNGFPNVYFGWGREDDDLYYRVLNANCTVQRLSSDIGRYKNLGHQRETLRKENYDLYKTKQQRYLTDGLSNLKYKRICYELKPLFTWIFIGVIDNTYQKGERTGSIRL